MAKLAPVITANGVKFLRTINIDVRELGVVMLELEQLPVREWLPGSYAYYPHDEKLDWIKGLEVTTHLTLLYGLLMPAWNNWPYGYREGVDEVLEGWARPHLVRPLSHLDVFNSPFKSEPYKCIVARISVDKELLEGHQRLSMLPHINTYLEYKPHVTLGYVHEEVVNDAIHEIEKHHHTYFRGLKVTGISLGDRML